MNRVLVLLALLSVGACSAADTVAVDTNRVVVGEPPLQLTVSDFPAQPGVAWARPAASASPTLVTVRNTRYGSLCGYDVSGHASVIGQTIELRITYTERLALCTADIRALSYVADVKVATGAYDVLVIHQENARRDTVLREGVIVP